MVASLRTPIPARVTKRSTYNTPEKKTQNRGRQEKEDKLHLHHLSGVIAAGTKISSVSTETTRGLLYRLQIRETGWSKNSSRPARPGLFWTPTSAENQQEKKSGTYKVARTSVRPAVYTSRVPSKAVERHLDVQQACRFRHEMFLQRLYTAPTTPLCP